MKNSRILIQRTILLAFSFLILTASFLTARAAGEVDPAFNPGLVYERTQFPYTEVNTIFVQPDGKVLIGGFFNAVDKINSYGIARLNADGTVDTTFHAPIIASAFSDYRINTIGVQQDGKIVFGGNFTGVAGQPRTGIARLNPDGSFDASFNVSLGTGPNGNRNILDIKIAADNKIIVVGYFSYNSGNRYIARLNSDGTLDSTFSSPPVVNSLTDSYRAGILPSGKILFAGANASGSVIYRLNADGSNDSSLMPITLGGSGSAPGVFVIKTLADGRFYVGGGFNTYNGFVLPSAYLLRFNADGSLDTNFNAGNTGPSFTVKEIEILSNNQLLVGGDFSMFNGTSRQKIAKINSDGSLDNSINFSSLFSFNDFAPLADGKILLGGQAGGNRFGGSDYRPALLKLNADGSTAAAQTPIGNYGRANKVFVQPDGKILVGGIYTYTDDQARLNISRLNADGTVDTTFVSTNFSGEVTGLDVRADGKILVSSSAGIVRVNPNGSLDRTFFSGGAYDAKFLPDGGVVMVTTNFQVRKYTEAGSFDSSLSISANAVMRKILLQPDGKYIVVGDFTQIRSVTRGRIARINADGTLDTTFNTAVGANNSIFDAVLQPDGKIVIGGNFTGINFDTNYKNLARLNADGSIDTSFNPLIVGGVQSLKIQPNGKILIGGAMSFVNGAARSGIARLNQDGSLDAAFNPGAGADDSVLSIDLQANGNVIIGGLFRHINNLDRLGIAQLLDASARTRFDFDGDGRADVSVFRPASGVWYTSTNPTLNYGAVQFGIASDKLVPADYDGDGKTDVAVFRDGRWYLLRSQAGFTDVSFGLSSDVPVPADYDGDGKADVAVFRASNNTWYLNQSTAGFAAIAFGLGTDVPVPADYDGDGKANVAVFRPSNGTWYTSTDPAINFGAVQFGAANDKPVPADYDGDGKADVAVFRPSNGTWYLNRSRDGFVGISFGLNGDLPVAADYDGDGKADVAVFRGGIWYLNRTTSGFTSIQFGVSDDQPTPNSFVR